MKKILVCLVFVFSVSLIFASGYIDDLLKDPSVTSELYKPIDVMTVERPQINPELEMSNSVQSIKIPFAYPYQDFVFGVNLPLLRKTIVSDDGKKSKSPIGIGDMSLSAAYTSYLAEGFKGWDFDYAGNLTIKLPTGDKDRTVKMSGDEYTVPMGSGSWDFIITGNALLRQNNREIFTDLKFRLNGENKDEVKNGNMLSLKGRYGFLQFEPKFDGYISLLMIIGGDGKEDSADIEMSMFVIDITPELHYLTTFGCVSVGISLPFITSAKAKTTRDVIVRFGISKEY